MNAPVFSRPSSAAPSRVSGTFLEDVLDGLRRPQKTLPAKYFYDLEGSHLFEEITRLPEYYPTRTELAILSGSAAALAGLVPAGAALVEFGSGSSEKIRAVLRAVPGIAAYVPIDVSAEFLEGEAAQLRADRPDLGVWPVVADFTGDIALPAAIGGKPLVGFFPGSTIGNFEPAAAGHLLRRFAELLGPHALLIVGVDLVKADALLHRAYDDAAGVTGRFNLNLLTRINRELGADFDLARFSHRAFFDRNRSRVEMHLVSTAAQSVAIGDEVIGFAAGETIHTENSYKYTPASFASLAGLSGWAVERTITDPEALFAVVVLRRRDGSVSRP